VVPSPVIPTSFVPKQPVRASGRFANSGGNLVLLVSIALLFLSVFSAAGVFAYERFLEGVRDGKKVAVEKAQSAIDAAAVEEFIRTRDRFLASRKVLDEHVAASRFFALLEEVTLANVRFNSLKFTLADDRSASLTMEGVARTFNALAAQSSLLSEKREVKRAIFSDIDVNEDTDTVSFSLSAELSPALLTFAAGEPAREGSEPEVEAPAAPSVPAETPPSL
jgi:hypothetical protein